jgi:hypothetical protein
MRFLPPEEQEIVCQALAKGLPGATPSPGYLSPQWCTTLSVLFAVPTFGYSLIVVPLLWVIQHDRTAARLATLRLELEGLPPIELPCEQNIPAA